MSTLKILIVIAGPTAVGKTSLAISLAREWRTEIVSADSRQVYREMSIGTAKPSAEELGAVPHHFIGSRSIHDPYDAGQYGRDALALIHKLFETHDRVILCGGSGLYISAVCDGFDEMPAVTAGMREKIVKEFGEKGLSWLQNEIALKDPVYFAIVDKSNPQRLMRALELINSTGRTMSDLRRKKKVEHEFAICKIGINVERSVLYQRIDDRMDAMIDAGLEQEARTLLPYRDLNALQTVGYSEWFDFFDGKYDREEAVRLLKRNTRHYAKRQLTWFTRDAQMRWFENREVTAIHELCNQSVSNIKLEKHL